MDHSKHIDHCRERVRSAIAPLTAPNPAEAEKIERAITDLINAHMALVLDQVRHEYGGL